MKTLVFVVFKRNPNNYHLFLVTLWMNLSFKSFDTPKKGEQINSKEKNREQYWDVRKFRESKTNHDSVE